MSNKIPSFLICFCGCGLWRGGRGRKSLTAMGPRYLSVALWGSKQPCIRWGSGSLQQKGQFVVRAMRSGATITVATCLNYNPSTSILPDTYTTQFNYKTLKSTMRCYLDSKCDECYKLRFGKIGTNWLSIPFQCSDHTKLVLKSTSTWRSDIYSNNLGLCCIHPIKLNYGVHTTLQALK